MLKFKLRGLHNPPPSSTTHFLKNKQTVAIKFSQKKSLGVAIYKLLTSIHTWGYAPSIMIICYSCLATGVHILMK